MSLHPSDGQLAALKRDLPAFLRDMLQTPELQPWQERALACLLQGIPWGVEGRLSMLPASGQVIDKKPPVSQKRDIDFLRAIQKQESVMAREVPAPVATRLLTDGLIEMMEGVDRYRVTKGGEEWLSQERRRW